MTDPSEASEETLQPPTESIRPSISSGETTQRDDESGDADAGVDPMVAVYRHDVHKARLRSHENAADWFGGIHVNEEVPLGADRDAALLSRPRGDPEQSVDAHGSWLRVSLLTGQSGMTIEPIGDIGQELQEVIGIGDAAELHAAWLDSVVTAMFNESPYYPYTSLKYHTLLVAALLDNYRAGASFEDLYLAVTPSGDDPEVIPHQTVLTTPRFSLHVTSEPGGRPAARLGDAPARSFADTWARLPELPFDVNEDRRWRVLDAQLRRVRSWSAALQYIEEYVAALAPPRDGGSAGSGGDGV